MRADLFIIGGGVIGLSIALEYHRLHPGHHIVIADQPTRAGVASRVAAGMLAPFSEFGNETPLFQLGRASLDEWPAFLQRHELPIPLQTEGTLLPLIPGEENRYQSRAQFLATQDVASRCLRKCDLLELEPRLTDAATEALLVPEALIHPAALHTAMLERASRLGITIIEDRIAFPELSATRVNGISTANGEHWEVTSLVIATGAWSREIGDWFELELPVTPVRGQLLLLAAADGFIRHTIHTHGIYLAPRKGHGIIVGATMEEAGFTAAIAPAEVAELRRRAEALVPETALLPILSAEAGFRPRTVDGLPVLGRCKRWENLFLATGHYRNGILLTPVTGMLVAEAISTGEDRSPYPPDRLGL